MTENKKIFDAEFEIELLKIDNQYLKNRINLEEKTNRWVTWILIGYVFLMVLTNAISNDSNCAKITKLQEEVALAQCEKDAAKYGAGLMFTARGEKSECKLLYSD